MEPLLAKFVKRLAFLFLPTTQSTQAKLIFCTLCDLVSDKQKLACPHISTLSTTLQTSLMPVCWDTCKIRVLHTMFLHCRHLVIAIHHLRLLAMPSQKNTGARTHTALAPPQRLGFSVSLIAPKESF